MCSNNQVNPVQAETQINTNIDMLLNHLPEGSFSATLIESARDAEPEMSGADAMKLLIQERVEQARVPSDEDQV